MGIPTHVMEFSSGRATVKGGGSGRLQFVSPLRQLNGTERWYITFYALPAGKSYEEIRHEDTPEYIQAGGRADKMQLDIRKRGGAQWGAELVRYIIGHPHVGNPPIDVPIELPRGPEFVSASEVFEAEEAAEIFSPTTRPAISRPATCCVQSRDTRPTARTSTCEARRSPRRCHWGQRCPSRPSCAESPHQPPAAPGRRCRSSAAE